MIRIIDATDNDCTAPEIALSMRWNVGDIIYVQAENADDWEAYTERLSKAANLYGCTVTLLETASYVEVGTRPGTAGLWSNHKYQYSKYRIEAQDQTPLPWSLRQRDLDLVADIKQLWLAELDANAYANSSQNQPMPACWSGS